jgi:hypothetical protein
MRRSVSITILFALISLAPLAHAALVDNGGGLIYDTDLNITWYDYTKSADTWANQKAWATSPSVTDVNGKIITGWRLPSTVDGPYTYGNNGTTTAGYNIITSEMGHLYYTELGNKGVYDVSGNIQSGSGLVNKGPFTSLTPYPNYYWSGTEHATDTQHAWYFRFDEGRQNRDNKSYTFYALAVHDGNVGSSSPVPIPPSVWILGLGLVGLVGLRRKFRK